MAEEEVVELVEALTTEIKPRDVQIVAGVALAGGLILGGLLGYKIAESRAKTKYNRIIDEELEKAKSYYKIREEKPSPETLVAELHPDAVIPVGEAADAMIRYGKTFVEEKIEDDDGPTVTIQMEEDDIKMNVFDRDVDLADWNQDEQDAHRASLPNGAPYIINKEEFMTNETGYNQVTFTYYAGDDTLVDEKDEPIPLIDETAGEINLEQFGFGSGDNNILYIRNDRLNLEMEVCRSEGKFAHEVLGFQHSDEVGRRTQLRKFRVGDE